MAKPNEDYTKAQLREEKRRLLEERRDLLARNSELKAEVERLQKALQNTSLVGRTLTDDYCNGFFGGHTFNLKGAKVCEESDLIVLVRRKDGRYFEADFDSRAQKHELMTKWTSVKEVR